MQQPPQHAELLVHWPLSPMHMVPPSRIGWHVPGIVVLKQVVPGQHATPVMQDVPTGEQKPASTPEDTHNLLACEWRQPPPLSGYGQGGTGFGFPGSSPPTWVSTIWYCGCVGG